MTELSIRPGPITLLQVLKLSGVAAHGADAQSLVTEGHVSINGEPESRKRRQLVAGDRIAIRAKGLKVDLVLVEGA
jgi:ribosome-associated protein